MANYAKNIHTKIIKIGYPQARREPQRGPGKHSRGAPKTCSRGPSGEIF